MIEAVNAVLSNASLSRGVAEQQSTVRSYAANPERVQEIAQAPYISPYIYVDTNFNKAVLQIRDSETGDVLHQFPSESQLKAYRRAQATAASHEQPPLRSQEDVERSVSAEDVAATNTSSAPAPQSNAGASNTAPQASANTGVDTQA